MPWANWQTSSPTTVKPDTKPTANRLSVFIAFTPRCWYTDYIKRASLASPARDVLESVGIKPRTNGLNLAVIPQRVHSTLHTKSYYLYINSRFEGLDGNRAAVEQTLAELQVEIQIYCQTGLKAW